MSGEKGKLKNNETGSRAEKCLSVGEHDAGKIKVLHWIHDIAIKKKTEQNKLWITHLIKFPVA